jgi:hypothetical protein
MTKKQGNKTRRRGRRGNAKKTSEEEERGGGGGGGGGQQHDKIREEGGNGPGRMLRHRSFQAVFERPKDRKRKTERERRKGDG